jgi:hypothetical protein
MSDNAQESAPPPSRPPCHPGRPAHLHPGRSPADQWVCRARPADHLGRGLEARLRPLPDSKQTGLRLDLERYLRYYNTERAHTGRWTRGRTPEAVLGKAKPWQRKR